MKTLELCKGTESYSVICKLCVTHLKSEVDTQQMNECHGYSYFEYHEHIAEDIIFTLLNINQIWQLCDLVTNCDNLHV
jgi:hypothetical protein